MRCSSFSYLSLASSWTVLAEASLLPDLLVEQLVSSDIYHQAIEPRATMHGILQPRAGGWHQDFIPSIAAEGRGQRQSDICRESFLARLDFTVTNYTVHSTEYSAKYHAKNSATEIFVHRWPVSQTTYCRSWIWTTGIIRAEFVHPVDQYA